MQLSNFGFANLFGYIDSAGHGISQLARSHRIGDRKPAIDCDLGTGHVARVVACKKGDHIGDFFGRPGLANRDSSQAFRLFRDA